MREITDNLTLCGELLIILINTKLKVLKYLKLISYRYCQVVGLLVAMLFSQFNWYFAFKFQSGGQTLCLYIFNAEVTT